MLNIFCVWLQRVGGGAVILNPLNVLAACLDERCMLTVAFYEIKRKQFSAKTAVGSLPTGGMSRSSQWTSGHGAFLENIWKLHIQLQHGKSSTKLFIEKFPRFRAFCCKKREPSSADLCHEKCTKVCVCEGGLF